MAENKNSFIKSKMNKDLDDRLVPNNEYRDGSNIAVSRSESQDVGALESVLGNEKVIDETGNGVVCIGAYTDEASGYIYWFMTNYSAEQRIPATSTAVCKILRWQPSSNTSTADVLVEGNFLNFSTLSREEGIHLLETLLFFTDNRNQPRVINVVTAIQDPTYYSDETSVTVCKFAPYLPPNLIDLRSISALKPSTMSNAQNLPTIRIGTQEWATENLNVNRYRNGDLIPEAVSLVDWEAYDTASEGCWCYYENLLDNGVIYGKLYNRWAVEDARNLAPYGYTIAEEADFTALLTETATGTPANIKSVNYWTTTADSDNNSSGFNAKPSGQRTADSVTPVDFEELNLEAKIWCSDVDKYLYIEDNANPAIVQANTLGSIAGYAVRVLKNAGFKGWQGDPEFIRDKFVRFSYRFKYADGEYSLIAPFSQECFIPEQEGRFLNDDEDEAMRSTVVNFMQNNINNIVLNIELPSLDIVNDYQVSDIDIIYKESDSLAFKVLQTVEVDPLFITNLNNTNIYQYTYQSTIPFKLLPTDETTRVYDKVPVRALAQAISGNRVMYANFIQGYDAPLGLDYAVDSAEKNVQLFEEYPQHSVKQNRNYQVGIILADKWGRQTDVILSSKDNVLVAGGEPVEGSNYYTEYRAAENATEVKAWKGENLTLTFDSVINVNGDAEALYAQPDIYSLQPGGGGTGYSAPFPAFLNWSTEELDSVAGQVCYEFYNLLPGPPGAPNTFKLWQNDGTGWTEVALAYTIQNVVASLEICFNGGASLPAGLKLKGEYLFNAEQYYRYEIENFGLDVDPATSIVNTEALFGVGRQLRGKYCDYTEIKDFVQLESPPGTGIDKYYIYTLEEIADNYMFIGDSDPSTNPTNRTEPLTDLAVNNYTYTINPTGFYSYRIVVKQQQQEYYNAYLPGIIQGYPIEGDTRELDSTAFITLVHDNINKIPRQLNEISNQDVQFNSDVTMFGRVTNNTASGAGFNEQYNPLTTPDSVEIIGSTTDIFPEYLYNPPTAAIPAGNLAPGIINAFSIFDIESKPFIAKVSTGKPIGVQENVYVTPPVGEDYPDSMALTVYETSPTISNLELFYETSSSGLISDVNTAIVSSGTAITGLSSFVWLHNEGDCANSNITTPFFAQTPQGIDVTATAAISTVYSFDSNDQVDPSVNRAAEFSINSAGAGAWQLQNVVPHTALTNFGYLEKYQITIQFTQADGTISNQSFVRSLSNDPPICDLAVNPNPGPTQTTILKATGSAFNGIGLLKGYNGGCDSCDRTRDLVWSITSVRWQNSQGIWYNTISGTNTGASAGVFDIDTYYYIRGQGQEEQATCSTMSPENFYGVWLERRTNVSGPFDTLAGDFFAGFLHEITMTLTDDNGTGESTNQIIQFTPQVQSYTGVVYNTYTAQSTTPTDTDYVASNQAAGGPVNMLPGCATASSTPILPIWVGEIANWNPYEVWIYIKISSTNGSAFIMDSRFGGYNVQDGVGPWNPSNVNTTFKAPADGTGNRAFVGPISTPYDTTGTEYYICTSLAAFNATNTELNAGVTPGDAGTIGGTAFDYSECSLINAKHEWTTLNSCSVGATTSVVWVEKVGGVPPTPPVGVQNVSAASGSPPFHTDVWYKTGSWPA